MNINIKMKIFLYWNNYINPNVQCSDLPSVESHNLVVEVLHTPHYITHIL